MANEFNPDTFLDEERVASPGTAPLIPAAGFDPDAFLREEKADTISPLGAGALGAAQGATFGFADEFGGAAMAGYDYLFGGSEDFEYSKNRDELRQQFETAEAQQPGAFLAGDIAGSLLMPAGAARAGITAGRLGIKGALSASGLAGGLAGAGASKAEDMAGLAADIGIGTGFGLAAPVALRRAGQAIKGVGKAAKAVIKPFVPGLEGAMINRPAAYVSGLVTRNMAKWRDIEELFNNPRMRTKMREQFNKDDEILALREVLEKADTNINQELKDKLSKLKKEHLYTPMEQGPLEQDVKALLGVYRTVTDDILEAGVRPKQFSSAYRREIHAIEDKLARNARFVPGKDEYGPGEYAKGTLHDVRMDLDNFLKTPSLRGIEKKKISDLRSKVDHALKYEVYGADKRLKSDQIFREFMDTTNGFLGLFKETKGKGAFKTDEITEQKVGTFFRGNVGKQDMMKRKAKLVADFVAKNEDTLDLPQVKNALNAISDFQKSLDEKRLMDRLDYIQGPTGAGVGLVTLGLASHYTHGLSLLAVPVTNPIMWTKIVDGTLKTIRDPKLQAKFYQAASAIEDGASALSRTMTRQYISNRDKKSLKALQETQ